MQKTGSKTGALFFFSLFFLLFTFMCLFYLAAPGLFVAACGMVHFHCGMVHFHCGTWNLSCYMHDLSSLTRDRTRTPCIGGFSHWITREVPRGWGAFIMIFRAGYQLHVFFMNIHCGV